MTGCYIIYSPKLDKFYVGVTQENVQIRLMKHNSHFYGKNKFTATTSDWDIFLFIPTNDFAHATRIEKKIKSMKSAKYIRNLKKFPELLDRVVRCT